MAWLVSNEADLAVGGGSVAESLGEVITRRLGVLPNFYRLSPDAPDLAVALWEFALFSYLDNPLPSLFKERLFVFLSRFCPARYCIARHAGYLAGYGFPSGDSSAPSQEVEDVIQLLSRPLSRGRYLEANLEFLEKRGRMEAAPPPASHAEEALFDCAGHLLLQTTQAARCRSVLEGVLPDGSFEPFFLLMAFIRTAHSWTTSRTVALEPDIERLLAREQELAMWIVHDPERMTGQVGAVAPVEARPEQGPRKYLTESAFTGSSEELGRQVQELRQANKLIAEARRAALNLLEDAVDERERAVNARSALAESEQKFRSLVEAHAQAIWEMNAAGEAIADSPSWRAYTGQALEEWLGSGWRNAIHPEDRESAEREWREAVAAGKNADLEFRLRFAEGGYRWSNLRAAPILDGDGSIVKWSGMNIDIHARRQAEAAAAEIAVRLSSVLAAASMGTFVWRLAEDRIEPDEQMLALCDQPANRGLPFHTALVAAIHPGDRARFDAALAKASDPRGPGELREDIRICLKNGGVRWLVIYAHAVFEEKPRRASQLNGVAIDITHRREAEEAMAADLRDTQLLRELGARFASPAEMESVFGEVNKVAILLARADAGTVQIYDEAAESLRLVAALGFPEEAKQRYGWVSAMSRTSCGHALATGQRAVFHFDENPSDPEGDSKWHLEAGYRSAQSTPLVSRSGRPIGMLSTHWREHHSPTERELRYLDLLARQAADLIERHQNALLISEREERLRILSDAVPQIIWTNTADGSADYFNKRWYSYSGLAEADSMGKGWQAIVHPDDAPLANETWRRALASGKIFDCEYRLKRADGKYRWFIGRNIPLRDSDGRVVSWFGTATDIHDLKVAEAGVRASEEQFRRAVQEAPIPVVMVAEDGKVLQVSRTWTELTGYTPEVMGNFDGWLNQAYGAGAAIVRDHMRRLFQRDVASANVELDIRTLDGDLRKWAFSASAPGTLVGGRRFVVGMALDITERTRAEEALRESQERLRLIVENARDYAIVSMDLDRKVTSWNAGAEALLGYDQDEILGRTADVIFSSEDRRAGMPEIEAETAKTKGRASDERWHIRKNGTPFWGSGVMMAMHDAEGRTVGLVKIFRDVTETRAAQKALEQSKAELLEALQENESARAEVEAASRAKDHFLAVLSHELRTPLTPVLMTTMTLQRRADLAAPVIKGLEMIRRNIQLECRLIDDLLDLTRIARGKLEIVREHLDLHDAIRGALEVSQPDIEQKKQQLQVALEAGQSVVTGDPIRLQQLIWNLLKNASKFTPRGGQISIATRNSPEKIAVRVTDSGAGIRPEKLAVIFDAFTQAEESTFSEFGGLGLGLAIAKATVEAHGGSIEATSSGPGQGSAFFFELPIVAPGGC